jgi:restriction system-associated AAA family ATPase
MKLLKLALFSSFRGLPKGFELDFRKGNYTKNDIQEPICLVGLNGSGKSNTLEVLSEIFYFLELKTIVEGKDKVELDKRYKEVAFEIHYTISKNKWLFANSRRTEQDLSMLHENEDIIIVCNKEIGKDLIIFALQYSNFKGAHSLDESVWNEILPNNVIGYSSGQNELISNPFIKLDYYYFDQFLKSTSDVNVVSNTNVNRMFFMDYSSNELVVLANYLFNDHKEFKWKDEKEFNTKLKISELHSFSITIRYRNYDGKPIEFPSEINIGLEKLKQCATTYYDNGNELEKNNLRNKRARIIILNFLTDKAVRKAFQKMFNTQFELFKLLYLLRLMNIHCTSPTNRNSIKNAPRGANLSDLIPKPAIENLVFKIDNINFIKTNVIEPVPYKNLSDGEHQLLHVIGTLRLMQENDTFFMLDEPETHFNPEWRAKMINLIMSNNQVVAKEQDHFITSHSPFIISDCKPNNVYIFNRDKSGKLKVETAAQKRLNTFGTSVNILTEEIFNKNESQGDYSNKEINKIRKRKLDTSKKIQKAKEDSRLLGDSVEKTLLFRTLLLKEEELKKGEK